MGTNYYLHLNACPHCQQSSMQPLHIGKSSGGWCFALHVGQTSDSIFPKTLEEWKNYFNNSRHLIKDEYGNIISVKEMINIITKRIRHSNEEISQDFLDKNHAIMGPKNLLRSKIDNSED